MSSWRTEEVKRIKDAQPEWMKDYAFWEIYCRKSKNWGVGPMATRTTNPQIEKEWHPNKFIRNTKAKKIQSLRS